MKKILVTGATGFIGNYVIEELLRNGYPVIATSATIERAQKQSWFNRVKYIPFDLKQIDDNLNYYNLFDAPDHVIHLAWEGLPNYKDDFHVKENLPRHFIFLQNLIRNGLKDLTVTGTCFEYGMREGELSEEMPALPTNPYGEAKNILRVKLEQLQKDYAFTLKWIRLFYLYGKGQNPKSLISLLDMALANNDTVFNMSGGQQTRDYLPIETAAAYLVITALQDKTAGIVNCCSGVGQKIEDFVKDYLLKKDKHIQLNLGYYPYTDFEPMHFWGNDQKLKHILISNK